MKLSVEGSRGTIKISLSRVDNTVKNWTRRQTGLGPTTPETKNTAATEMATPMKRFVVFLFYKMSEANFLHAKWRFWVITNKPHQVMWRECGTTSPVILMVNTFYLSLFCCLLYIMYKYVPKCNIYYASINYLNFDTEFNSEMSYFVIYFYSNFNFCIVEVL